MAIKCGVLVISGFLDIFFVIIGLIIIDEFVGFVCINNESK